MLKMRTTLLANCALAISLAASLLAGCGKNEETKSKPQQGAQTNAAATNNPSAAAPATPAPTAAPAPPAAPAIASAEGDMPGFRAEVQELKRTSDGTVSLKFAIVNNSDNEVAFIYNFGDPDHQTKDYGAVGGVNLIDGAGKKKYFVVRDTEGNCVCSRSVSNIAVRSRAVLFAKFPGPPDDVQKISVVIPHFVPMDDVPISR